MDSANWQLTLEAAAADDNRQAMKDTGLMRKSYECSLFSFSFSMYNTALLPTFLSGKAEVCFTAKTNMNTHIHTHETRHGQ